MFKNKELFIGIVNVGRMASLDSQLLACSNRKSVVEEKIEEWYANGDHGIHAIPSSKIIRLDLTDEEVQQLAFLEESRDNFDVGKIAIVVEHTPYSDEIINVVGLLMSVGIFEIEREIDHRDVKFCYYYK